MSGRVEINAGVMLGKPVIRGTRVPVELLLRKLAEGATTEDLLDAYPRLIEDDIRMESPGVVLIRFRVSARGTLAESVLKLVREYPAKLKGAFVVLRPGSARISFGARGYQP